MPEMIFPERDELEYLEKILNDSRTMAFCGSTIPFPETEWDAWLTERRKEAEDGGYFRLIYCDYCGYFVGACGFRKVSDDIAVLFLLIEKDLREEGYGSWTLQEMGRIAMESGIRTMLVKTCTKNPYLKYLARRGFTLKEKDGDQLTAQADTSVLAGGEKIDVEMKCCCRRNEGEEHD